MSNEADEVFISDPVDLTRQVYVDGGDFQLLCCGPSGGGSFGGGGSTGTWLTAAELAYELTGHPGKVVKDVITFEYDQEARIEIDVLGGHFKIQRGDEVVHSGRKALELLMQLKEVTFEQALEWIAEKYSTDKAAALAQDYVKMRVAALAQR